MTADRLAAPEDLASLLERDDIDAYKAGVLVECASAVVQSAARNQRIVQVVDDTFQVMGTHSPWLSLPQIPVTDVSAVTIDGCAITDFKRYGNRLYHRCGWSSRICSDPGQVAGVYTHGFTPGAQDLQLGRSAVLSIIASAYGNPGGAKSETIDDYSVMYAILQGQMDSSPFMAAQLSRTYGRRAGAVQLG